MNNTLIIGWHKTRLSYDLEYLYFILIFTTFLVWRSRWNNLKYHEGDFWDCHHSMCQTYPWDRYLGYFRKNIKFWISSQSRSGFFIKMDVTPWLDGICVKSGIFGTFDINDTFGIQQRCVRSSGMQTNIIKHFVNGFNSLKWQNTHFQKFPLYFSKFSLYNWCGLGYVPMRFHEKCL